MGLEEGFAVGHATASLNRPSIERWGLDWRRMYIAPGIAGSTKPELDAVFLDYIETIDFFTNMSRLPCDVWEVDVSGLNIEEHEGWMIHRGPIGRERLRLAMADIQPRRLNGGETPRALRSPELAPGQGDAARGRA